MHNSWSNRMIILSSFGGAAILGLVPFSENGRWFSPQWALLLVIYWSFYSKKNLDLFSYWCIGLVFDLLYGSFIGQYAGLMALLCYWTSFFGNRLKLYSIGGQGMVITVLLGCNQMLLYGLYRLLGHPQTFYSYTVSVLSSLLLWPLIYKILKYYERKMLA